MNLMINNIYFLITVSFAFTMLIAIPIINWLYRHNVVRLMSYDLSALSTHSSAEREEKNGTPIMGGLMFIVTIVIMTLLFNWNVYTQIPILVFLISAFLGGIDDLLNIFGRKRIVRPFHRHLRIARVHRKKLYRIWLFILTPWILYKNFWFHLGSYPGKGIHAGEKIIVQFVTGSIVAYWAFHILGVSSIWLPVVGNFFVGAWIVPILIFLVILMSNAVNISDGMDGLASGLLILTFSSYLIIAMSMKWMAVSKLLSVLIGSLLAYLYFNVKPARVQMGDVGSLAMGTMLAVVAILTNRIILLPIIGGVFIIEISSSFIQGIYKMIFKRRLFKMAPFHLHLYLLGWNETKTVQRLWILGAVLAILGLFINTL